MVIDPQLVRETELIHNEICHALDDPKRLLILQVLADRPQCVNDLADALDLPQPTVSRHLKILRDRALVETTRQGSTISYSLADPRLIKVIELLRAVLHDRVMGQARVVGSTTLIEKPHLSSKDS